jgi:phytoene dehydrogenase-like protein
LAQHVSYNERMSNSHVALPNVLIIGAGVAGLSAGCYAQMNGFRSRIFESHTIPGGLCTSWRREGYLFDGAVRYLVGTGESTRTYPMWRELGVLPGRGVHYYDEFMCYEGRDGRAVHFYTDPDRLESHLLGLSPADAEPIREFTTALRQLSDFDLPLDLSPDDGLEGLNFGRVILGHALPLLRWMNLKVRDFAQRFRDPLLREAFPGFFQCTPDDFPMLMLLMTLAPMAARTSGYPIGGSLALAQSIEDHYKSLGGKIHYGSRVTEVLVENDCAVGVRLADGCEHRAGIVISAADGRSTIFDLLNGRYVNNALREHYSSLPVAESIVQVSLGVRRDFGDVPPMLDLPLDQPIDMGHREHQRLVLKHYCFDPTMTDPGKSALTVWAEADYAHWQQVHNNEARYTAEKARIGEAVVAALERRFPGLASQVDVIDVATPVTYERYTGNWRGSIHGWALGMQKMQFMMRMGMSKTLPGLRNFYRIGQWVEPAGNVQLSAASGRDVIEMTCRACKRDFVTMVAEERPIAQGA